MKRWAMVVCIGLVLALSCPVAWGSYLFYDSFETPWSGEYYGSWTVEGYRWGAEPVAIMKQDNVAHSGSHGLQLEMKSVASSSQYWGNINANVPLEVMQKQYNPYISVWMKDTYTGAGSLGMGGQLYAVPSLVKGSDDWTDVQFGARPWAATQNYYATNADIPTHPPWINTGVARDNTWHHLMFQLSAADGYIRFYLDGNPVGISTRNDYTDLGTAQLSVMFNAPLSGWGDNKPYALFDDFVVGSDAQVPAPSAMLLLGSGLLGLVGLGRRLRK